MGLGSFRGEKAGTGELIGPTLILSTSKTFSDPALTQGDVTGTVLGLNWVRNLTARSYMTDSKSATTSLTYAGGKFNLTFSGKMNRSTGSGEFPETIQVDLVAEGIPTK